MATGFRELKSISGFITKGATPTTYGFRWEPSGIPFLRSECVSARGLDMLQAMFISPAADAALKRSRVRDGDILMTITGNVGRVVKLQGLGNANINQHIARVRVTDPSFSSDFVYHYLSQPSVRAHFETITTGQAYPQISLRQVRATAIPVLPLSEQRQIAAALTTADRLVESLVRLISKKRAVKQGMMQELLAGKTRLPGFSGDWQVRAIGEVAMVIMGQSPPGTSYNSRGVGVPLIQGNADIANRETVARIWTTEPTKRVRTGDVVLTVRAPVGYTSTATEDACLGRGVCALSTQQSNRFLYHALVFAEPAWALLEQGSTFTSVNSSQVRAFEIAWAREADERTAIGEVLDEADAEIAALEQRLESARAIKQGMMQELLTSRTRLVEGSIAA